MPGRGATGTNASANLQKIPHLAKLKYPRNAATFRLFRLSRFAWHKLLLLAFIFASF